MQSYDSQKLIEIAKNEHNIHSLEAQKSATNILQKRNILGPEFDRSNEIVLKSNNFNSNTKKNLYLIVFVLALVSIFFRIAKSQDFDNTSIFYVGLPTLITLLVIKVLKRPTSAYGTVFTIITLFLLLSSILFGEGIICIIIAAPLFYGVAAIIVSIFEWANKNHNNTTNLLILPVILILLEPIGLFNSPKSNTVVTKQVYNHNISLDSLNKSPDLKEDLAGFFEMGFPLPLQVSGQGTQVNEIRKIQFESPNPNTQTYLTLKIIESDADHIVFGIMGDNTIISQWLTWQEIRVDLKRLTNTQSEISWSSTYTCELGPQWYFNTIQRYAVGLANEHLIRSYFRQ